MICEECFLKVIFVLYIFEKSIIVVEENNMIVFKVVFNVIKVEIKVVVEKFFEVEVIGVCILNVKGKIKCIGMCFGCCLDWKKVYVIFKEGSELDFVGGVE